MLFSLLLWMAAGPFAQAETPTNGPFDYPTLVAEVLAQNPTVAAAQHVHQQALARAPQVKSAADPRLNYQSVLATARSEHGYGQVITLSQRLEWPGKQALRESLALSIAEVEHA